VDADAALVRYLAARWPIIYLLGHQEYRRMEKTPLFYEAVPGYRTEKSDPGEEFMRRVRERVADLHLKTPPAN
jgi:N-acetylmuramoyl-L-alanine amidase